MERHGRDRAAKVTEAHGRKWSTADEIRAKRSKKRGWKRAPY
jgi:hypothetical protein